MATALANTVNFVRRFLIISALLVLAYFLLTFGLGILKGFSPFGGEATPKAEGRFSQLPALSFRNLPNSPKEDTTTFALETVSGLLPTFPDLLPVFPIQTPKRSLLVAEKAKELANVLGFTGQPTIVSPSEYLWEKKDQSLQLRMSILTLNYVISPTKSQTFLPNLLPNEETLKTFARNFLSQARPFDKSFDENKTTVSWLRFNGQTLVKAESLSEADAARVDFFRTVKIGEVSYPLLTTNPQESSVQVFFRGGQGVPYEINYTFWPYDFTQGSTYPLKNVSLAWEKIKKGQATIVLLSGKIIDYLTLTQRPEIRNVTIREIKMAYFDDKARQSFLQPIYVFSGQADFKNGESSEIVLYVPAVDERWVIK